ncbi:hypothetical protein FQR65_LT04389 [Abscondita terminalis]|nr:hypothetical protein FQR65_LT04389 [Abscondita terminalis]
MKYLKSFTVMLLIVFAVEVPAYKIDGRIEKRSTCAVTFNPNYTPEQLIDIITGCVEATPKAFEILTELAAKFECSGSVEEQILCVISNNNNYDTEDYDQAYELYMSNPECRDNLIVDTGNLSGHELIENIIDCLGDMLNKKRVTCSITFNPKYTPDELIDATAKCIEAKPEAVEIQNELAEKYNCVGSIREKVLCIVHNRDNFDDHDYDLNEQLYIMLPECTKELIVDDGNLTGHELIKAIFDCLGALLDKKRFKCAITFNPKYTPEELIDETVKCIEAKPEAIEIQNQLAQKFNCVGSLKEKALCVLHNRNNYDDNDYDLNLQLYYMIPDCTKELIVDEVFFSLEVPANKDDKCKIKFNPDYTPEELLQEYLLCLTSNLEAFLIQIRLALKYGCSGTLLEQSKCLIENRVNFDDSDFQAVFTIYSLMPDCAQRLVIDEANLTGIELAKALLDCLGYLLGV